MTVYERHMYCPRATHVLSTSDTYGPYLPSLSYFSGFLAGLPKRGNGCNDAMLVRLKRTRLESRFQYDRCNAALTSITGRRGWRAEETSTALNPQSNVYMIIVARASLCVRLTVLMEFKHV